MKATINAAQFNVTIKNAEGVEVMTYSVENASFAIDMSKALSMVSEFSHLFKKLDASHNVAARDPIDALKRPANVDALLKAASRFKRDVQRLDMTAEQHDVWMTCGDAVSDARADASKYNVRALVSAATALIDAFEQNLNERVLVSRIALRDAIAAV